VEKQTINIVHERMIWNAEAMTIDKSKCNNKNRDTYLLLAFEKAIVASSKAEFLQDAVLAAHLTSQFCFRTRKKRGIAMCGKPVNCTPAGEPWE
jgi:hypothetical protein